MSALPKETKTIQDIQVSLRIVTICRSRTNELKKNKHITYIASSSQKKMCLVHQPGHMHHACSRNIRPPLPMTNAQGQNGNVRLPFCFRAKVTPANVVSTSICRVLETSPYQCVKTEDSYSGKTNILVLF